MAGYSVWAVGIVWENFKFYKCAKSPTAPRKYHCGEIHHFLAQSLPSTLRFYKYDSQFSVKQHPCWHSRCR